MKKKVCPVCDREYTEKNKNRYRHFDRQTGKVTWHTFTLLMAGKA